MSAPRRLTAWISLLLLVTGVLLTAGLHAAPAGAAGLRALLIGGGPDPSHNQVAIESNVRYVQRLLPAGTPTRILFADGSTGEKNVLYEDAQGHEHYRATQIPTINGPTRPQSIAAAFRDLRSQKPGPVLLYFTGHGSPDDDTYQNNQYDCWGRDGLTVRQLAAQMETLPSETPVTLVMVQCFSGAFGNVLFQDGDPKGKMVDRDVCGFFASVPDRPAAGCTPEVNEADYHDFTSYFFAALGGVDRLGKRVSGADYNGDGAVGMNEAFAYTLLHDVSIDTPVCTSDVFVRRFITTPEALVFQTGYTEARGWANPAQRAVLDGLSTQLKLTGDDRLSRAYATYRRLVSARDDSDDPETSRWIRFVRTAKTVVLEHTLQTQGETAVKARFALLLAAEARNPLRP